MKQTLTVLALAFLATPAYAQNHAHGGSHGHSPYAGLEKREVKALSAEQIADLHAGRGMSLALPAELNGYPGPLHALELADPLALTHEQRAKTEALLSDMKKGAAALGARIVAGEQRLDGLFASGTATRDRVRRASAEIASLQGELRALHLAYHLDMKKVLTAQQVARYNALRGYGETARH